MCVFPPVNSMFLAENIVSSQSLNGGAISKTRRNVFAVGGFGLTWFVFFDKLVLIYLWADSTWRPCYSQNKEHRKICSDCTLQINPDAATMMWRVSGHRICCTRSDDRCGWLVCFRMWQFLMSPKKAKASPHNAPVPFIECYVGEGCFISISVVSDLFLTVTRVLLAPPCSFCFVFCPFLIRPQILVLLPFPLQPVTFLLTGSGSVPLPGPRGCFFFLLAT